LANINSIEKTGLVLIIDDSSYGTVFLKFSTQYDTDQAHSLLNYVLKNANVNINLMNPVTDDIVPIVYFNSKVGNTGNYIAFNGATAGVPYDTSYGGSFSTSISLGTYGTASGTYSVIDSNLLVNLLIHGVNDNRDGTMSVTGASILINGTQSIISATGSYTMTFNLSDIAQNYVAASVALTITN
jgi:hypothetical protein